MSVIIEGILSILMFFIKRGKVSEENVKEFYKWVKMAGSDMGSVRLMESSEKQLKWMKENPWKAS